MNKHLKTTILKALGWTTMMTFMFYFLFNNNDGLEKDLKTIVIQSVGGGILFGIIIYFFDRPKKEE
jgi:hypothetical protein